jgi:hypothetical protein
MSARRNMAVFVECAAGQASVGLGSIVLDIGWSAGLGCRWSSPYAACQLACSAVGKEYTHAAVNSRTAVCAALYAAVLVTSETCES